MCKHATVLTKSENEKNIKVIIVFIIIDAFGIMAKILGTSLD